MIKLPRHCGRALPDGGFCSGTIQPAGVCPVCAGRAGFAGGDSGTPIDRSNTAERRRLKTLVRERANGRCEIRYPLLCAGRGSIVDRIDRDDGYYDDNCCWACHPCHGRKTSWEALCAKGINADHLKPPAIKVHPKTVAPQPQTPFAIRTGGRSGEGDTQGGHSETAYGDILSRWQAGH